MEGPFASPAIQLIVQHFHEQGRMEAALSALLRVLRRRGFHIDVEVFNRIAAERDRAQIEAWLDAAVTAKTRCDVFV